MTVLGLAQIDTVKTAGRKDTDTVFIMKKSAWGAVLRSAVIPGWGQFYNQSYWKVPVVWGVTAWFVYNWIDNNNNYTTYKNAYYKDLRDSADVNLTSNDRRYRDFYHDQRDLFAIYLGLAYLLNLVDAYVDAHMFDFTVKEDMLTKAPCLEMHFTLRF